MPTTGPTGLTGVTGVVGHEWRGDVDAVGAVHPWDGSGPIDWHVAADDRWHDTRTDTGIRHRRIDGVAVFETKVRIPGGDAVQRLWSVAAGGGHTMIDVHNDSSMPIAVAFTRSDLLTSRPPATVPIEGIDLPAGSFVVPVGHRTSVTVALAHRGSSGRELPGGLADADAVVRGWVGRVDAASRLELPESALVDAVRTARCEVALLGPSDIADDPARFLLGVAELVRMAELDERDAVALVPEVAAAIERVARDSSWIAGAALAAAGVLLATAGERRALDDLGRIQSGRRTSRPRPADETGRDIGIGVDAASAIETVAAVEHRLLQGGELFPGGIPTSWLGADFEAHGLVAGPRSRLSLAVRWHGPNAAVLWDIDGDPVRLSTSVAGDWSTTEPKGEALWQLDAPRV